MSKDLIPTEACLSADRRRGKKFENGANSSN